MVRWKPINYALPNSLEAWNEEFDQYKQYPEYELSPEEITLEKFKKIFFIEWAHRTLGNIIGGVFTLPLVYFWGRGYLKLNMKLRLTGLFAFGLSQG